MAKMHCKGSNHLSDLISFIEQNEYKNIEVLIKLYPEVIQQKCYDDKEPIYFAIRMKASKIFNLLLTNSSNINYKLPTMMKTIRDEGTRKMLRSFINHYKINLQCSVYKPLISKFLLKTTQFHSYLLLETHLPYSISIPPEAYKEFGYTCPYEIVNGRYKLSFNKADNCENYDIDSIQNPQVSKGNVIFMKFEKVFLCTKKATKLQKALKEDTFKEILGYI